MSGFLDQAQIMSLLDISDADLMDPRRMRKLQDIFQKVGNSQDVSKRMLKLVNRVKGRDKLDEVWTKLQLEAEYGKSLESLNAAPFSNDIKEEIGLGFLSKEKLDKAKQQTSYMDPEAALQVQKDLHKVEQIINELSVV